METSNNTKNKIVNNRLKFFAEVVIVFIGIFLFLLIPIILLQLFIERNSTFYGPLYYLLRAICILIAIPLFLFVSNIILNSQEKQIIVENESSPATAHFKLYSVTEGDFKEQLLFAVLILFIVFIPLDFLIYFLVPEMLEYTGNVLSTQTTDTYLLQSYYIFLISVILIQISVAIYEESLSRGFLTKRGSEYFHKMSAVIISSLYFGLMHFAYFFNPISKNYPIWFPFIWFLQTFTVGIMLSIYILKKKRLFPVIFAHALNNIISAHAVWNYLQGNDFSIVVIYLYLPLLVISVALFILYFPRIKHGISTGFDEFKTYFKKDESIGESKVDLYFRIFFDFIMGVFILILGFLLV
ncbi:MAG: CPBP family intramembrane glutamic endopeptidase [Candidatus Hodarchaeota archaeon]